MLSTKLKETAGNSADATLYVDDVFSTWLYTGNGSTQTITNGIDLAGKGGMVWIKSRTSANPHQLIDTSRGGGSSLASNTNTTPTTGTYITSFNSNGFSLSNYAYINASGDNFASWTFREAPKFFDVVTYTGTGSARTIAHNLGIAPGMVIVKRTDTTGNWRVYSNGLTSADYFVSLDLIDAQASASSIWNSTAPTSSVFSVGVNASVNASGGTYVAYLYAHDTSSTGIIQCGTFTSDGSGNVSQQTLGWEPQYILWKVINSADTWRVFDTMRDWSVSSGTKPCLRPNYEFAETNATTVKPNATGFSGGMPDAGGQYIYMAIRMPNKPPTTGTQVYTNAIQTTGITPTTSTTGFVTDLIIQSQSTSATNKFWSDRLRGTTSNNYAYVISNSTSAEATGTGGGIGLDNNTGFSNNLIGMNPTYNWNFKRAPGFFDEVCYTGTGADNVLTHNLGTKPLLVIGKCRSTGGIRRGWPAATDTSVSSNAILFLNQTNANSGGSTSGMFTSTTVNVGNSTGLASIYGEDWINKSGDTYVLYMFATLAGISKVGSYTGNGTGQAIACGFSGGARFVLIKRTDDTGGWYTFDSARGLTSGSSPYLLLNSTAAEVTGNNGVYASTGGFTLGSTASTTTNINGASYIYLSVS